LPKDSAPDWQMWPIPKPRDGLRVVLQPASGVDLTFATQPAASS